MKLTKIELELLKNLQGKKLKVVINEENGDVRFHHHDDILFKNTTIHFELEESLPFIKDVNVLDPERRSQAV